MPENKLERTKKEVRKEVEKEKEENHTITRMIADALKKENSQ
jgi:hypothetical protein